METRNNYYIHVTWTRFCALVDSWITKCPVLCHLWAVSPPAWFCLVSSWTQSFRFSLGENAKLFNLSLNMHKLNYALREKRRTQSSFFHSLMWSFLRWYGLGGCDDEWMIVEAWQSFTSWCPISLLKIVYVKYHGVMIAISVLESIIVVTSYCSIYNICFAYFSILI